MPTPSTRSPDDFWAEVVLACLTAGHSDERALKSANTFEVELENRRAQTMTTTTVEGPDGSSTFTSVPSFSVAPASPVHPDRVIAWLACVDANPIPWHVTDGLVVDANNYGVDLALETDPNFVATFVEAVNAACARVEAGELADSPRALPPPNMQAIAALFDSLRISPASDALDIRRAHCYSWNDSLEHAYAKLRPLLDAAAVGASEPGEASTVLADLYRTATGEDLVPDGLTFKTVNAAVRRLKLFSDAMSARSEKLDASNTSPILLTELNAANRALSLLPDASPPHPYTRDDATAAHVAHELRRAYGSARWLRGGEVALSLEDATKLAHSLDLAPTVLDRLQRIHDANVDMLAGLAHVYAVALPEENAFFSAYLRRSLIGCELDRARALVSESASTDAATFRVPTDAAINGQLLGPFADPKRVTAKEIEAVIAEQVARSMPPTDVKLVSESFTVALDDINSYLAKVGLVLVVGHWDGQGERELPRDATRFEIITESEWSRRTSEPSPEQDDA